MKLQRLTEMEDNMNAVEASMMGREVNVYSGKRILYFYWVSIKFIAHGSCWRKRPVGRDWK